MHRPTAAPFEEDPSPERLDSTVLFRRATQGDQDSLNRLFLRHQPRLLRIVRNQMSPGLRRRFDALDVVQNTFTIAARKLAEFEPRRSGSLLRWLSAIARNQIRDMRAHMNRIKRDPSLEVPLEAVQVGGEPVREARSPQSEAAWQEEKVILQQAVTQLPSDHGKVLRMRNYMELEWEEIASRMDRSVKATRQLHRRARLKLALLVGPRLGHEHPRSPSRAG